MFAKAYKLASCFTQAVIVGIRYFDKSVESALGAFVVVNSEGWIISVAHLWNTHFSSQEHVKQINDYNLKLEKIKQDQKLTAKQRSKKIAKLKPNPKWITEYAFLWSRAGVQLKDAKIFPDVDLAIGRLDPFDPKEVTNYPVFKNPINLSVGTSLCKLGYPFLKVDVTFNEEKNAFDLARGREMLALFPIDGIYTRDVIFGKTQNARYDIRFLETSTPGLRGQSGGPVFDVQGTVWAIQSRTKHFQLGFNPKIKKNGKEVEEHQFLNAGLGVHPELIVAVLKDNGVRFNLSDY